MSIFDFSRMVNPELIKRIEIPLFEIASNPTIPLTSIKSRVFSLIHTNCCVCEKIVFNAVLVYIKNGRILKSISRQGKQTYHVCELCLKKTRKKLVKIRKLDPMELPLYISDKNLIIKNIVAEKLERV